jgi:hypothetical protein
MKKIMLAAFLAISLGGHAQNKSKGKIDLFEEQKLEFDAAKKYAGQIVFSNDQITRDLPESKYIKSYTLGDKLSVRAWLNNSVGNSMMLQLQESGVKPKEINQEKHSFESNSKVLVVLYLDGKKVTNTSYAENFDGEDMATLPTIRADLNDGTEKIFFGESLYQDLLKQQDLLTPGVHKLKLEMVPIKSFGIGDSFSYKPVAVGEIDMIVPQQLKLAENDCFPKKEMSDPKLEAEAMRAVKKFFKDGAPYAIKVILTQKEIKIVRQEYTGIIIRKSFNATVVHKNGNDVWYDWYTFYKEYDGSQYLDAVVNGDVDASSLEGKKANKECLKFLK